MSETLQVLVQLYTSALQYYIAEPSEAALEQAYEMGRKALADGVGLLEMVSVHEDSLITVSRISSLEENGHILKRANEFLKECLAPFEMTHAARLEAINKQLEQANARLRELDRLKSMFIASMSHELRTPLNSIIGFTGIILQGMVGEINEEQRKQLTMVKNSAVHLLALINDIIDLSKIEASKVELSIEPFDISVLGREVKDSFDVAATGSGLKMSLYAPKTITIESDRRRVKQVLMNLVSNAIKFTDKGSIEIVIEEKGQGVEALVRDTGIGITGEDMDRLFRPFSQILIEGRLRQEGTGLGLYLSKKIANLLGGEIKAESEFRKGSVFTFTLPLKHKGV